MLVCEYVSCLFLEFDCFVLVGGSEVVVFVIRVGCVIVVVLVVIVVLWVSVNVGLLGVCMCIVDVVCSWLVRIVVCLVDLFIRKIFFGVRVWLLSWVIRVLMVDVVLVFVIGVMVIIVGGVFGLLIIDKVVVLLFINSMVELVCIVLISVVVVCVLDIMVMLWILEFCSVCCSLLVLV